MQANKISKSRLVAVVLAGGASTRFGNLGELVHKALLPVTEEQTLLSHNLNYFYESGITEVVVSTSPESFPVIESFIHRYNNLAINRDRPKSSYPHVIANSLHSVGSLAALSQIVSDHPGNKYLMSFADIFFFRNPYLPISSLIERDENFVGGCKFPTKRDWARGGLMLVRETNCKRMFLRPGECEHYPQNEISAWSGITLFNSEAAHDLREFMEMNLSSIEEDFINFCLDRGRRFAVYEVGRFINVNSYSDYLEVLCSSYRNGL